MNSKQKLPTVEIKNIDGNEANTATIPHSGMMLLVIWEKTSHASTLALSTFAGLYDSWKQKVGVEIVAVSVDKFADLNEVISFVKQKNWGFDFYFDPNKDFARALGVNGTPMIFLVDTDSTIVWKHTSFAPGDEDFIYHELQVLSK